MSKSILPNSISRMILGIGIASLLVAAQMHGQVIPQRISYQGIARSTDGLPIVNTPIATRITILNGSVLGNVVFQEEHNAVTNEFGLFTLQIGGGAATFGGFSSIDWGSNLKFMRLEIDPGNEGNFVTLGTSQLLSVPYALAAGKPKDLKLSELSDVSIDSPNQGEGLVWDGTAWVNGGDRSSTVSVSERLEGSGASSNPLDLARQGATFNQVLKWDGVSWNPANDVGQDLTAGAGIAIVNGEVKHDLHDGDVMGSVDLTVTGLRGKRIVAIPPTTGQVLKYIEGQGWIPSTDNSQVLIAGNGIDITGRTIRSTIWSDNGTNAYRIAGSVAIGTSTPTEQVHITKNLRVNGVFKPGNKPGILGQVLTSAGGTLAPTWEYPKDLLADISWSLTGNANVNSGTDFLGTTDTNPLIIKTNGSERVRVLSGGNVGVGTGTPGAKLEVSGGDVFVNGSANGLILKSTNGNCWRITVDNSGNLVTTNVGCP